MHGESPGIDEHAPPARSATIAPPKGPAGDHVALVDASAQATLGASGRDARFLEIDPSHAHAPRCTTRRRTRGGGVRDRPAGAEVRSRRVAAPIGDTWPDPDAAG